MLDKKEENKPQRVWEVAVSIYPALHKFWKTRIITLTPRYLIANKTSHTIIFRQVGCVEMHSLIPQEKVPFHWTDEQKERRIRIRLNAPDCSWSGPIDPTVLTRYPVRLFNTKTGSVSIVRVIITAFAAQSMSIITLEDESLESPMFRVDNLTGENILLKQKVQQWFPLVNQHNLRLIICIEKDTELPEIIAPRSRHAWSWQDPTKPFVVDAQFGREVRTISFTKVRSFEPFKFKVRNIFTFEQNALH